MKTFISGSCTADTIYSIVDPSTFSESEFEAHTRASLQCTHPDYYCIPFRGQFAFDGNIHEADLALIHKSFSHWFVIEVELASHSLGYHVLPQVRSFRFGKPLISCSTEISRYLPKIDVDQAHSLIHLVPKGVAVIANQYKHDWASSLKGCDVQLVTVSVFKRSDGTVAYEMEGSLHVPSISLGFFSYSAPDRSLRLPHNCGFSEGPLQIEDPFGVIGIWIARTAPDGLWITKEIGDPGISHNSYLQILKTHSGKIIFRTHGPTNP